MLKIWKRLMALTLTFAMLLPGTPIAKSLGFGVIVARAEEPSITLSVKEDPKAEIIRYGQTLVATLSDFPEIDPETDIFEWIVWEGEEEPYPYRYGDLNDDTATMRITWSDIGKKFSARVTYVYDEESEEEKIVESDPIEVGKALLTIPGAVEPRVFNGSSDVTVTPGHVLKNLTTSNGTVSGNEIPGTVSGNEIPGTVSGNEIPGTVSGNEMPGTVSGNEIIGTVSGNEISDPVTYTPESLTGTMEDPYVGENKKVSFSDVAAFALGIISEEDWDEGYGTDEEYNRQNWGIYYEIGTQLVDVRATITEAPQTLSLVDQPGLEKNLEGETVTFSLEELKASLAETSSYYAEALVFTLKGAPVEGAELKDGTLTVTKKGDYVVEAQAVSVDLNEDGLDEYGESATVEIPVRVTGAPEKETVKSVAANPAGGTYKIAQNVTLSTMTAGAEIYYTLDGTNPTRESTLYTGVIEVSESLTLKAIACKEGLEDSPVASFTYTIDPDTQEKPIENIKLSNNGLELKEGDTAALTAEITPTDATEKTLFWTSTDKSIVTVNDGLLKGINAGTAVVRVSNADGSVTAACEVTVKKKASEEEIPEIVKELDGIGETVSGNAITEILKEVVEEETGETSIWVAGLSDSYTYTGSAIKPRLVVYDGVKKLAEKTDYTVTYGANKTKEGSVKLSFKGSYAKQDKEYLFAINPVRLGKDILIEDITVAAKKNNKSQKPVPVFRDGSGTAVKVSSKDVSYTYHKSEDASDPDLGGVTEPGIYYIKASGKGENYSGSDIVKVTVVDESEVIPLSGVKIQMVKKSLVFTGSPITPEYKLTAGTTTLVKDTDYTVEYLNNTEPGTATVIFSAKSNAYTGTASATFKIAKGLDVTKIDKDKISVEYEKSVPFVKTGAKPAVYKVTVGDMTLVPGTDYTVTYKNNKAVADASDAKAPLVTVSFKGSYKGSKSYPFSITKQPLSELTLSITDKVWTDKENNYVKPAITLTGADGKALSSSDYTISYFKSNGVEKFSGKAVLNEVIAVKLTASEKSGYRGTIMGTYRMIDKSKDISKTAAKKLADQSYTGSAITLDSSAFTGILTDKSTETPLAFGTDFIVDSYTKNVNKGIAKVKLTGIGSYGGSKTLSFKITEKTATYKGLLDPTTGKLKK